MVPVSLAQALLILAGVHLTVGVVFAIAVWVTGLGRIDRAAEQASRGARALLTPSLIVLWPFLLRRWRRGDGELPVEDTAHRRGEAAP